MAASNVDKRRKSGDIWWEEDTNDFTQELEEFEDLWSPFIR